ncbi:unnamed protein product [Mucor hiemalis]
MKSFLFSLFVVCALLVNKCYCKCDCDPNDNGCVSDCVVEANSCVTSCHGNIECYESCIDDKWPSAENSAALEELEEQRQRQEEGLYRDVIATTTVYSIISPSSSATTASATMSASTSVKQADTTHTSSGSNLISSITKILAVTVITVLLSLK